MAICVFNQNELYTVSVAESEARVSYEMEIRARERRREYGMTQAEEDDEMFRREDFSRTTLKQLETKLKIVCQSYQVCICAISALRYLSNFSLKNTLIKL